MKARGETRTTRYVPGPKSYAFAVDATHTLLCSSVHWESTTTPTAGRTITQPADRTEFGRALAPGEYLSVHSLGLRQTCFITARAGPGVLGQAGGQYEASGTPAG